MTRILSVFNVLKRVGFVFLLLGACSSSHAQQILWERDGEGDSSRYGREILPLGDQNLDGFDDFAAQAFGVGPQGSPNEARLEFYHGGNPPGTEPYLVVETPPDAQGFRDIWTMDFNGDGFTDWFLEGDPFRIYFGGPDMDSIPDVVWPGQRPETQVQFNTIGDFNGDGNDDFYRFDPPAGDSTEIFFGGMPFDTIPEFVMHSPSGFLGRVMPRTYGDLNGDGIDDFITTTYPGGSMWLYIYHGSSEPDTIPDQEIFISGQQHVHVDIVPDLNGDGKDDLILFGDDGWPGQYHVFLGGDTLASIPDFNLSGEPGRLDGARNYGPEIAGAGDVNNDGINDLLTVAPNWQWGTGRLYLGYHWLNEFPVWTIRGRTMPYDLIGIRYCAGVGDINNDGFDDVAFGAFNTDFDGYRGRAVVLAGQAMQVAVDEGPIEVPDIFDVSAFPNPFNSTLSISLDVPLHQEVTLSLYDLLGREVDVVYRGRLASSTISYVAPAAMASGVYFLQAVSGEQSELVKVVLLK